jgi:hypothetical protein
MNIPGRLDLTLGPCRWENTARHVLAASGLLIVLTSPTAWPWKLAAVAMLGLTWRWSAEPQGRGEPRTILTVYPDGAASVSTGGCEAPVELTGRAWTSRLVCVFELSEPGSGKRRWHRACAGRNAAADFRRLAGMLRLHRFRTAGEGCLD